MDDTLEDRFLGTLFGQAVGDALGLGMEFMSKADVLWYYPTGLNNYEQIVQDDHRKRWLPGDWTDDTEQMTMILDSLLEMKQVDICDIARRFWNWVFFARGVGVGNTVCAVLEHPDYSSNPHAAAQSIWEQSGCWLAANGAIMRTSVMGLWDFHDRNKIRANAEAVCKITHFDPRCVGSCVAVSVLINALVKGRQPDEELLGEVQSLAKEYDDRIEPFFEAALSSDDIGMLALDRFDTMGYTLKTLSAGIWALTHASSFEEGLTQVIHQGGDADTNGAVAGALLGARYGMSAIPVGWLDGLTWREYLKRVSQELLLMVIGQQG